MEYERNLKYLNNKRIVYRRDPIKDKPTKVFDWGFYFENGTRECYTLFNSKAKINTYKSLKWHLYVLWYLNPKMNPDQFILLSKYICDKRNGFVTFSINEHILNNINYDVSMSDLDKPPPNKIRKIIFKDNCGLDINEKLSIVGKLIGRKNMVDQESIYQCMIDLHDMGKKITIGRLAGLLDCSTRTIHRNMGNELKKEKELLNMEL
jgi:hypothetical protein